MTPLHFEQQHQAQWQALANDLQQLRRKQRLVHTNDEFIQRYRSTCEHLAIAQGRAYPAHLIAHLQTLTAEAHQLIYQSNEVGWRSLVLLFSHEFPTAVRRHAGYVWLATAVLMLPALIMGMLVHARPELILSVLDAASVSQYERMYADSATTIRDWRGGATDWMMFGFYIRNNIGVSFQCFASGLLAGLGSLFYLAYNGAMGGAVAGYLTLRGMGSTFYSFIVTHAAFELTAIVLSGAAGLRLGHALLAPGRRTRTMALVEAARDTMPIIYGVIAMLLIAAAIEAFWSSQRWLPLPMKYSVAAVCWCAVFIYLLRQGRGTPAHNRA